MKYKSQHWKNVPGVKYPEPEGGADTAAGGGHSADYYAAACVRPGLFLISQQNR